MIRFAKSSLTAVMVAGLLVSPAPVSASDGDDLAGILAGLLAVGIIAKAIDDRGDRKDDRTTVVPRRTTEYGRLPAYDHHDRYRRDDRVVRGRISPWPEHTKGPKGGRGYKKYPLPASCLLRLETRRHDRQVYGARCLQRNFKSAKHLPNACAFSVRTGYGLRTVYGARCLEQNGWRTARF